MPRVHDDEVMLAKTAPREERRDSVVQRSTTPPATVLVADDDPSARSAIRRILSAEGYDVLEASDGSETLELLSRAADQKGALPDVVLLDFVMPGFSGLGILRVMRRFERVPPTIIMTGFLDPTVETLSRALGAVRVLRKPLDADDLLAAVLGAAQRSAPAANCG